MEQKLRQFDADLQSDPAVDTVVGFTGGGSQGGAQPTAPSSSCRSSPRASARSRRIEVIARLRPKLRQVAGARLFLQAVQDIRAGGRQSNAQYQYTLQGNDVRELYLGRPSWSRPSRTCRC